MTITVWPVNAVTGAPVYSGRMLRQTMGVALAGAKSTRPLGAMSGVRPGTPTDTVAATSTTWTCKPHAGVIDGQSANEAGAYWYAVDANVTGSVTAANATNPRKDIIYAQVSDPAESDGSSVPKVDILYQVGTAAASPTPPATPARSMRLAIINVPQSGGGSPTVTWDAPYATAPGAPVQVRSDTERDAVATAWGATDENPLDVLHIGTSNAKKGTVERTYDGTTWAAPETTREVVLRRVIGATNSFSNPTNWTAFPVAADNTALSTTFVKRSATTKLILRVCGTVQFDSGASQIIYLGARIGATDYEIGRTKFPTAVSRQLIVGETEVTGLAAGSYSISARLKSGGASAIAAYANDDSVTLSITETA